MNRREKTLVAGVVGLGVLWGGWSGYDAWSRACAQRVSQLAERDEELFAAEVAARRARRSLRLLEELQGRSLPADPDVARSAYSAWLVETVEGAGLELAAVKWASTRDYADAGTALTFNLNASGPPEGVVRLLDAYHRLPLLHQIVSLQVRPAAEDGSRWGLSLSSVAMIVAGTTREAGLPEGELAPARLRRARAEDYVESVVGRNVFASYTSPPPPKPQAPAVAASTPPPKPSPPPFDDAEHAALSGIVGYGDAFEAWVVVRTTGETLRVRAGDPLSVGLFKGRVESVGRREMTVIDEGGSIRQIGLGEKLRDTAKSDADPA